MNPSIPAKVQHSGKPALQPRLLRVLAVGAMLLLPFASGATTYQYWDLNGTAAGASNGDGAPSGTWNTVDPNWNTNGPGTSAVATWQYQYPEAIFSAGSDATNAYTITMAEALSLSSVKVEEGTVTFAGTGSATITNDTGNVTVAGPATMVVDSEYRFPYTRAGTANYAQLVLSGGGTYRWTYPGAGNLCDMDYVIKVSGAGTVDISDPSGIALANHVIISDTFVTNGSVLTKTGPGEFRSYISKHTFTNLVVREGLYSAGHSTSSGYDESFGRVPVTLRPNAIVISNAAAIRLGGGANVTLHANRGITIGPGGGGIRASGGRTFTISGPITGGGLTINTTGTTTANTVVLTGSNTHSDTTVLGGVLQIAADSSLGTVPASPVVNLTLDGGMLKDNNTSPTLDAKRTISLGAGGGYLTANLYQTLRVNGQVTGSGALNIANNLGAVALANTNNDFAGGLTVGTAYFSDNALLRLGASNVLPDGAGKGDVSLNAGGTLDMAGFSETVNGLSGAGKVDNTAGGTSTLTVGNADVSSQFDGILTNSSGSLALTKIGAGAFTLAGTNGASGTTTVSNGTLMVNGYSGASAIVVQTGAMLGGNGVIDGAVTVSAGGTFSPGASVGTLTLNNNLTLRGDTLIEIDRDAGNNDLVQGIGALSCGGKLIVSSLTSPLQAGDSFRLFSAGSYSGSFTFDPATPGDGLRWVLTNGVLAVINTTQPTLQFQYAPYDGMLQFSWTGSYVLQAQTNAAGIGTNWHDYVPGGTTSPVDVTINPASPPVLFRLRSP
jgi:autotransporter-associated beta strand protein